MIQDVEPPKKQIYLPLESDHRPRELAEAIANTVPPKRQPLELKFIRFNEMKGAEKLREEDRKQTKKLISKMPLTRITTFEEALQKEGVTESTADKFAVPQPITSNLQPKYNGSIRKSVSL